MARDSLYILGDRLAGLLDSASIRRFDVFAATGGMGLRFYLVAAHVPDIVAEAGTALIDLLVMPDRVIARWQDGRAGLVEAVVGLADDAEADWLDEALRHLPGLPARARAQGQVRQAATLLRPDVPAIALGSEAIALLLRHRAVQTLMVSTDGIDASLQFQCEPGFAPVSARPPQDWVGLDLDGTSADLSFFDADDRFRLHSLRPGRDDAALAGLLRDPLGFVLSAGAGAQPDRADANALLGRLTAAFASLPL